MKGAIALVAITIIISTATFGQKMSAEKVPIAVKTAFCTVYTQTKGTKWEK